MAPDTSERRPPLALKDPALLRHQCYIDGRWSNADSGATFDVVNPATAAKIGTAPMMGAGETARAIEAADKAWPAWRAKTAKERSAIMRKWSELQLAHAERNQVRAAYNKAQRLPERRKMMQSWADYLDGLRAGANVVPIRRLTG